MPASPHAPADAAQAAAESDRPSGSLVSRVKEQLEALTLEREAQQTLPIREGALPVNQQVQSLVAKFEVSDALLKGVPREKFFNAVLSAVNKATAEGIRVTETMTIRATERARSLGTNAQSMEEQAHCSLVADAAAEAAVREAEAEGRSVSWYAYDEARAAATALGDADFAKMLKRASSNLDREKEYVYVANIIEYKKEGLDIILSMATMGGVSFQVRAHRGMPISEVANEVRFNQCPAKQTVRVKLIGPAGTLLNPDKVLPEALDYELDAAAEDKENGQFYPLSVLKGSGDSAAWKKIGLDGATRWMFLREKEFEEIFLMSKASFTQLPPWKQIPLKKKHDLF